MLDIASGLYIVNMYVNASCVFVCVCVCVRACACMHVCMYACMNVCVYIYYVHICVTICDLVYVSRISFVYLENQFLRQRT